MRNLKLWMITLLGVLVLSCSSMRPAVSTGTAEGSWKQLEECAVTEDPDVYQCPRWVLENVWDCMVKCHYSHSDCQDKLHHCEQLCELDLIACKATLSQCKTNHWYWGGGGLAAGLLTALLLVLL